jgi:hypothetical protein
MLRCQKLANEDCTGSALNNRPRSVLRASIILGAAIVLAGCVEEKMADCVTRTEPTILLRALSLSGQQKKNYEACKQVPGPRGACEVAYLDADEVLTACMAGNGYSLSVPNTSCKSYYDAVCYKPTWLVKAMALVMPNSN